VEARKGFVTDGPYVAAKAAAAGLADVLRQELAADGVTVMTVLPGWIDTSMNRDIRVPWLAAKSSPALVADRILRALKRPAAEIVVPRRARALMLAAAISPRLGDWLVRRLGLNGRRPPLG
jgi:NAD(P)-dependent dehydrogenase (short-subunit alcohol dehydrogenase family)